MYTKEYKEFLDHRSVKEMETVEDAIMYLCGVGFCGDCSECPTKGYKGGGCNTLSGKATDIIKKAMNADWFDGTKDAMNCLAYMILFTDSFPLRENQPKKCDGTCATCELSEEHASGIRFCKSFGNFVHDDGYCYRHPGSVNMEKEQALRDSLNKAVGATKPLEDYLELPF